MITSSPLLLASKSETRRMLLKQAGIDVQCKAPLVDEEPIKQAMIEEGASPLDITMTLAELKAQSVSRLNPGQMIIGGDQLLVLEGNLFSKATTRPEAIDQLKTLSGKTHQLISAAVIVQGGQSLWRGSDKAKLTVRPLSEDFINAYLNQMGDTAYASVGCYQLEGLGAHLFTKVDGDYYTILGLPLLHLLKFLRERADLSP